MILLDERPIGFLQSYRAADYAEEWPIDAEPGTAGLDLLVGEPDLVGRGLGPEILRAYAAQLFDDPTVTKVIAGVELDNTRSLRAFEKAGFVPGPVVGAGKDQRAPERLMVLRRRQ